MVQTKTLTIVGVGFGAFAPGWSGVLINGSCAPVSVWDEHKIVAVVPPGVGLGLKRLTVLRGDGARAFDDVVISGVNIPSRSIGCELNSFLVDYDRPDGGDEVPNLTDVSVDVLSDGADGTLTDVAVDHKEVQDDFIAPDYCPAAVAEGPCNNDWDCPRIIDAPEKTSDIVFTCMLDCMSDDDPFACDTLCLSSRLSLTDGCSVCHAQYSDCVFTVCRSECAIDTNGESCVGCRVPCDEQYQQCSGLVMSF